MANDLAQGYFIAPNTSSVIVKLCDEDRGSEDEGMSGELSMSMYGPRSVARNWQICFTDLLCNCGVTRGTTCMFRTPRT